MFVQLGYAPQALWPKFLVRTHRYVQRGMSWFNAHTGRAGGATPLLHISDLAIVVPPHACFHTGCPWEQGWEQDSDWPVVRKRCGILAGASFPGCG